MVLVHVHHRALEDVNCSYLDQDVVNLLHHFAVVT